METHAPSGGAAGLWAAPRGQVQLACWVQPPFASRSTNSWRFPALTPGILVTSWPGGPRHSPQSVPFHKRRGCGLPETTAPQKDGEIWLLMSHPTGQVRGLLGARTGPWAGTSKGEPGRPAPGTAKTQAAFSLDCPQTSILVWARWWSSVSLPATILAGPSQCCPQHWAASWVDSVQLSLSPSPSPLPLAHWLEGPHWGPQEESPE